MQQAFDTTEYLISRADEDRARIRGLQDQQSRNVAQIDSHEVRISSLERSRARSLQVVRLLPPLLALILAGAVALGPGLAVDLAQAIIKTLL